VRLEEVLTNVVSNALEMLSSDGQIHLHARPDGESHVVFEVEDDGPGVAPSIKETLFKPFVTTKKDGTGLGLPICRRIVEEHGGTIELADGRSLDGACFRIRLAVGGPEEARRP
jgi:signal transduction histidine kinase